MRIQLSASGTPAQVTTNLAQQFKAARATDPSAWAAIATFRDYVAAMLDEKKPTEKLTVTVGLYVDIGAGDEATPTKKASRAARPRKHQRA